MSKKFYILPQYIKNNKIYLSSKEAHHIKNVLRYKINDQIIFFDSAAKEYISQIENISRQGLIAQIKEIKNHIIIRNIGITLVQALPKLDKFDLVVQKATELGVNKIIPVRSQRSAVNLETTRLQKKKQRWEKIAKEACQQCGRVDLPQIELPQPLKLALALAKNYDLSLFFCLDPRAKPLKEILKSSKCPKKILIFIGPEGDFNLEEINGAKEKNVQLASLGHLVLRAETAAITILSILDYEYN